MSTILFNTVFITACSQTQNDPALGGGVSQVQQDPVTTKIDNNLNKKVSGNTGAHTHPANKCTRSISHTHPNGTRRKHNHKYSCTVAAKQNPHAHRHPANKCTRSIMHVHPSGKSKHSHRYSCQNKAVKGTITSTVRRYKG
ncbi:MAG: hypothetical protein V3V19_10785 [Cocleimonas sp.]